MKPDIYMPFYGRDFFLAVEGQPDSVVASYLRAIWYQWGHNHGKPLEDNDEFLRRVCHCDKSDWGYVRGVVFDNAKFFSQDAEGRWSQSRVEEVWDESKVKYDSAVAGGKNRWKGVSKAKHSEIARAAAIKRHAKNRC